MSSTAIFLLFVLMIIIVWCLRQFEIVSNLIKTRPQFYYFGVLLFINLVITPMWFTALEYEIIMVNLAAVIIASIASASNDIIQKLSDKNIFRFLNNLDDGESEENEEKIKEADWSETFDNRGYGNTQDTYDNEAFNEEGRGNIVGDDEENIYDEAGGNTSGSEQYNFSKTEKSKGIKHKNQSKMEEKAKEKDIKRIEYNKKND